MVQPTGVPQRPILALVNDLFFILKIEDSAKSIGVPTQFAGSIDEFFEKFRQHPPGLIIIDLMLGEQDSATLFDPLTDAAKQTPVPILGYTTHADWKRTSSLHSQCTKVVTKEVLSRSLPDLMQQMAVRE
jgi:CheY-like chemotaxis protein